MSADSVAQDQLQAFVRRIESLEDEINALNGDKSEVYKEAKGNGFDTKVLRKVIADRRKDASERNEFDAVYQLYWDAVHGVVRAHVENIEEFGNPRVNSSIPEHDADGVIIEPEAAMLPQTAGSETAVANSTPGSGAGTVDAGGANWPSEMTTASPANEPETTIPPAADPTVVVPEAGDDRSAGTASATVVAFRINTKTHFANSKGLPRLHGCLKPEACGGSHRSLCFGCSVQHDGPAHQEGAA